MSKITILALHLETGGAENVICNLSNILCEDNEVEIISTYKLSDKPAFYIDPRVNIKYLSTNLRPNRFEFKQAIKSKNIIKIFKEGLISIKVLRLRKKLMIQAIKDCDSDIIISTRVLHNFWLGKYGNKNAIKIAQEHNHHNNNQKIIKKTIKSLKSIDYFMPVSRELTDFYANKIGNTKSVYIPSALDYYPEEISKLDNKNFIAVGRLAREKGFEDLIEIFKELVKWNNELKLRIVGDGDEKVNLQRKIDESNLNRNIELCGMKTKIELDKLYLDSSVYLMTSYTESFGLVLLEAESYGIPIVAFDSAQGAKEIIENNKNGFLISDRNKNLFIEKAKELISDENFRNKIGKNGREDSKKYKKENIKQEWKKFLGEIKK